MLPSKIGLLGTGNEQMSPILERTDKFSKNSFDDSRNQMAPLSGSKHSLLDGQSINTVNIGSVNAEPVVERSNIFRSSQHTSPENS